ncbi:MAG: signal peptidase II [Oscillospiraceae bacterium]|nr:signal peptidase II [Oscillospiraceae bacterium]
MPYLLLAAAIALGDQLFKHWYVSNIAPNGVCEVIPGILQFTYVKNTGASWGIFSGMRWPLLAVTVIAAALIIYLLFTIKVNTAGKIGLACVLGGAIGNGIDRFRLGYVVDMLDSPLVDWYVFNIADVFITGGGILFCICYLIKVLKEEKETKLLKSVQIKEKPRGMPELNRLKDKPEQSGKGEA